MLKILYTVTIRDITFAISDISDVSDIIPFVFWWVFGRKGRSYNVLGCFFFISGIIKIFTLVTAELHVHNLPAYHLLAFLEITFVYSFYRLLASRKINYWLILTLLILYTGNTFIQHINDTFNSNTWTFTVLVILVIGLSYFYHIYKSADEITPLAERPDFIITAGWLIYASGSLFTYLMGTDILSGYAGGFFKNAWIFECVSNIIKNTMICFGFWLTGKR